MLDRPRSWRRIGSELAIVAIGQCAAAFGSLVGVRVLTGALTPAVFGELALALTGSTLVFQVVLAPLGTAALRFFAQAQQTGRLHSYLRAVRTMIIWATIVVCIAGVIVGVATAVSLFSARWTPLVAATLAFSLFSGMSAVVGGMQNAARQRGIVALHDGAGSWLRFLFALLFIQIIGGVSFAAMAGYALAAAAVLTSQYVFFRHHIAANAIETNGSNPRWSADMLAYAAPFAGWGVFTWAQMISDRWALEVFSTSAEVGKYAAAYSLGFFPVLMMSNVLVQLAAPVLFERAGDASDAGRLAASFRANARILLLVLGLTVVLTATVAVIHPLIARLLLAPAYRGASSLLPWLVLSGGLFATGQIAALFFMIAHDSKSLAIPKIVTATGGALLTFVAAHIAGVWGVIFAGLLFSAIFCIWVCAAAAVRFKHAFSPAAAAEEIA